MREIPKRCVKLAQLHRFSGGLLLLNILFLLRTLKYLNFKQVRHHFEESVFRCPRMWFVCASSADWPCDQSARLFNFHSSTSPKFSPSLQSALLRIPTTILPSSVLILIHASVRHCHRFYLNWFESSLKTPSSAHAHEWSRLIRV